MARFHRSASLLFAIACSCIISSCSDGLHIEKRHYRSGFYIRTSGQVVDREKPVAASVEGNNGSDFLAIRDSTQAETAEIILQGESITYSEDVQIHTGSDEVRGQKTEPLNTVESSDKKNSHPARGEPADDLPAEQKTWNTLFWAVVIALCVAAVLFGISLLFPPFAAVVPILAGTAYGLGFLAVATDVVILIIAGNRKVKLAESDASRSAYYRKLERRALWVIGALAIIGALLLLALIVAAIVHVMSI